MIKESIVKECGIKGTYVLSSGAGLGLGYKYQDKIYKSSNSGYCQVIDPEKFIEDNGQGYMDAVKGIIRT